VVLVLQARREQPHDVHLRDTAVAYQFAHKVGQTLRRVRKEWAGDDFCLSGGSAGGIPDNRVPRLHVELLARVLVAVGGIVAYAPVELKRLV
jgi:hypothetical protein